MTGKQLGDHWHAHARQWQRIGSPLRPVDQDVELMRTALGPRPGHGLLLGVTAELTALSPSMNAIERDPGMIEWLWAPRGAGQSVRQGDWLALPFAMNSFDFAVGDGSLTMLPYPDGYRRLFEQLRRCLRAQGRVVLRVFATPQAGELPQAVFDDALAGSIGSFHAFKWRLAMALVAQQGSANIGVAALHAAFEQAAPDRAQLAQRAGWVLEEIDTIDVYRNSPAEYSFPTLAQLAALIPPDFVQVGMARASYELAACCPIISLRLDR